MILENISLINVKSKIKIECDECHKEFERTLKIIKSSRKKRNSTKDFCTTCSYIISALKKPQCTKEYWNLVKKEVHGNNIKCSKKYKIAIRDRDNSGENNPMFNKKHKLESISNMVISHTGKKQSLKTIEKRKKTLEKIYNKRRKILNVNKSIRGYLNNIIHWYRRIYERDGFKCTKCPSTKKLDAHHVKPLNDIIKELTLNKVFKNNKEKYNYLITCSEIIDVNLENGITLCRNCHQNIHYN